MKLNEKQIESLKAVIDYNFGEERESVNECILEDFPSEDLFSDDGMDVSELSDADLYNFCIENEVEHVWVHLYELSKLFAPEDWFYHEFGASIKTSETHQEVADVFYVDCSSEVIQNVVKIYNENKTGHLIGSGGLIDTYLLDADCSTEDRESIVEQISKFISK